VLIREVYGDGHTQEWALLDTAPITDAVATQRQYGLRTQIEERHRALKCFYDLSDFRSCQFNVITAQVVMVLLAFAREILQLEADARAKVLVIVQRLEQSMLCPMKNLRPP